MYGIEIKEVVAEQTTLSNWGIKYTDTMRCIVARWTDRALIFLQAGIMIMLSLMMINEGVQVTASESYQYNHERSIEYLDNLRDLIIPAYLAGFGNSIVYARRINLMYPPDDDDGYLCRLPTSFENVKIAETSSNVSLSNEMSIGLLVKYGGNCTAQHKAEMVYEIQKYYPKVDTLLIYNSMPPPNTSYYETIPYLSPDVYPVSNIFDQIGILYVGYSDANKIIDEIKRRTTRTTTNESKSPYFNPDLYMNNTTTWTFNFLISGQPNSYYNNGISKRNGQEDENPTNFIWFRIVLFGLLIIAPFIRAMYLWYAGGGRIYIRRHEQTGRIIGLQYIPPIASWLSISPTRLQQPSTPIRDVISEEEFNNLPEIRYTEPILVPDHDAEVQSSIVKAANDQLCVEHAGNDCNEPDELNTSFNSAAEKGIISIVDNTQDNSKPIILNDDDDDDNSENNIVLPSTSIGVYKSNIESNVDHQCSVDTNGLPLPHTIATPTLCTSTTASTTSCTTCSICIEDFMIGEILILLPRYVRTLLQN